MEVKIERLSVESSESKPKQQLILFPYAGASAHSYKEWNKLLPDHVDVLAIQLPGRGSLLAKKAYTDLANAVEDISSKLSLLSRGPFVFFGHSMGALIAFETARYLERVYAISLNHLVVSARVNPDYVDNKPQYHLLNDEELVVKLRSLNGTPQELLENQDMLEIMLPALRADYQLCETYRNQHKDPVSCPITVYGGVNDKEIPFDSFAVWKKYTKRDFSIKMFNGDHFFIHTSRIHVINDLKSILKQYSD